jgi:Glycosyltransferase Family 4
VRRVGLVDLARGTEAETLHAALRGAGRESALVRPPAVAVVEALLRHRGFTGPLTPVPAAVRALAAGTFDVVHGFSAPDMLAARAWRRRTGGPVVFTCVERLDRGTVADRRLRLRLLRAALDDSDAVVASTPAVAAALWRWTAIEAAVVAPGDAEGYARVYDRLA